MEISKTELVELQVMQSAEVMLCYAKDSLEVLSRFSYFSKLNTLYNLIDEARDEIAKRADEIVGGKTE